jgi:hypothetical protein
MLAELSSVEFVEASRLLTRRLLVIDCSSVLRWTSYESIR